MSLGDFMRRYAKSGALRLHTPGHKGRRDPLDLTELTDKSFPSVMLADAEKRCAAAYGAKHARFLCCGSSQGVKAAVLYSACDGIIDVNSHRSVFDGYMLSGKEYTPVGLRGVKPLSARDIKAAMRKGIGAVVVTSPTYYGYCADVDGIKDFCRDNGLLFIVDGAHGAHFGFSKLLPKSAASVADICELSAHKTLSALTQSAVIADNLSSAEHRKLSECVDVMGTTSPSYLLYSSIEDAVDTAASEETESAYAALFAALADVRHRYPFLENDDFTRLVLDCGALGVRPDRLNGMLARRGVMSELVDNEYIVFLFTAADGEKEVEIFDRLLYDAVKECNG